jgi:hypothetical protein
LVEAIEPMEEGFRVTLAARHSDFVVELAERREVYRLRRLRPPDDGPPEHLG